MFSRRPYKLVVDAGNPGIEPRTRSFGTAEAAVKALKALGPEWYPYAEVRGPNGYRWKMESS